MLHHAIPYGKLFLFSIQFSSYHGEDAVFISGEKINNSGWWSSVRNLWFTVTLNWLATSDQRGIFYNKNSVSFFKFIRMEKKTWKTVISRLFHGIFSFSCLSAIKMMLVFNFHFWWFRCDDKQCWFSRFVLFSPYTCVGEFQSDITAWKGCVRLSLTIGIENFTLKLSTSTRHTWSPFFKNYPVKNV